MSPQVTSGVVSAEVSGEPPEPPEEPGDPPLSPLPLPLPLPFDAAPFRAFVVALGVGRGVLVAGEVGVEVFGRGVFVWVM